MIDKLSKFLMKIAQFMGTNKYLSTIKDVFTVFMPFIITGSFANLFNSVLSNPEIGLARFNTLSFLEKLGPAFSALSFACMTAMAIPIVFLLGLKLGEKEEISQYHAALVAILCYIAIVPQSLEVTIDGTSDIVSGVLPSGSIGASGLFLGFFVAALSVKLFSFLMRFDKIKIKMPETVPTAVAESFNSLFPLMITLFTFTIVGQLFKLISGSNLLDAFYKILQLPLESAVESFWGIALIAVVQCLLWMFGIHGNLATTAITAPLMASSIAANIAASEAGQEPTQIFTTGFWGAFLNVGGTGITISLLISLLLFSKRPDYKQVAKLALIPGLFGINEPVLFGLPIVMNPTFAIPFILSPVASLGVGLLGMKTGMISPSTVDSPFGVPIFVRGFLSFPTFNIIILTFISLLVSFLIYLPFVLVSNHQYELELKNMGDKK